MSASVTQPFSPAWNRTRDMLFRPFDPSKWAALGFMAWLSSFGSGYGGFNMPSWPGGSSKSTGDSEAKSDAPDWLGEAFQGLEQFESWMWGMGAAIIAIVVGISLLWLWLTARGQFMFLDNVVRDRTAIKETWGEFQDEARSYFFWTAGFWFVATMVLLALGSLALMATLTSVLGVNVPRALQFLPKLDSAAMALVWMAFSLALLLTAAIHVYLSDFVAVLMWKRRQSFLPALTQFRQLFGASPGPMLLYLLFRLVLQVGASVGVTMLMVATCCIAAVPLAIPVVGTIILCPVPVFFRLFSIEFLRQFGRDFDAYDLLGEPVSPPDLPEHFQAQPGEAMERDEENPYSPFR